VCLCHLQLHACYSYIATHHRVISTQAHVRAQVLSVRTKCLVRTHTHTYLHTHIRVRTHTCKYAYAHWCAMHTSTHVCAHSCHDSFTPKRVWSTSETTEAANSWCLCACNSHRYHHYHHTQIHTRADTFTQT